MRYRFIQHQQTTYPVRVLCQVLAVSRSGFYAWRRRRQETPRQVQNRLLLAQLRMVYYRSQQRYGSPRIHRALRRQGVAVGRHRVARLMRQAGLRAHPLRRRMRTTQSEHTQPVAPHRLQRAFTADGPNEKWVCDITYIPTRQGWLYLALILDLYARRVVGWAMRGRLQDELTQAALRMAVHHRRPKGGLLHHSDQGRQYASRVYGRLLAQHRILPSMSRKANCWDNAPMESFIATLKTELIHQRDFQTQEEARQAIFEYIEVFYNRQRLHSALDYLTPVEYERQFYDSLTVQ